MKKLAFIVAIVVGITAFGQGKAESELFRFDFDYTVPRGTVLVDEKGSPYIHVDLVQAHAVKLIEVRKDRYGCSAWEKRIVLDKRSGKWCVNGMGVGQFGLYALNVKEGRSAKGMVAFATSLPPQGEGLSPHVARVAGEVEVEWDETERRYVALSGRGQVAGFSNPDFCMAGESVGRASIMTLCKMFPAWGTFTMRQVGYTDAEIVAVLLGGGEK